MRSAMHPGDLPGEDYRSSVVSDVSSFEAIMEAADFVYALCGKALRSPGWAEVGKGLCNCHRCLVHPHPMVV